jgi:hypothetical protein
MSESETISMDLSVFMSSITAQKIRDFLGLSSVDPPTDTVILQMIRMAETIVYSDSVDSLTTDQIEMLIILQTACQMSYNNLFSTTKTGITNYTVGKIGITFNTDAVLKTKEHFCKLYNELLSKFNKTTTRKGYVGMTNKGSGLAMNSTKRNGPIYLCGDCNDSCNRDYCGY